MKKGITLLLSLLILLVCCKKSINENIDIIKVNTNQIERLDSNFVNLNTALSLATNENISASKNVKKIGLVKSSIEGNVSTKKVKNYFIYSELVKNAAIKTNQSNYLASEPLLYIINFEGGGASVVSSDRRFGGVIIQLDTNTTIENGMEVPEGFILFMQHAAKYIKAIKEGNIVREGNNDIPATNTVQTSKNSNSPDKNKIAGTWESECAYDFPDLFGPFGNGPTCDVTYNCYYINTGPLLQTAWGQWTGYNDLVPLNCGIGKAPTGCVATAMAQVMAMYQFPYTYNWSSMPNSSGSPETARLMRDIGSAVNMTYGCQGSGAYMTSANNAFHNMGYNAYYYEQQDNSAAPNLNKYQTWLENRLSSSHPVIVGGCKTIGKTGWWIFKTKYYS
ncbi:MAG: C10 family peptidase, partial [Daejeonella sp.]